MLIEPLALDQARDWTYVRKDGKPVAVSLTVSAMVSDEGKLRGYLSVARDVTRQKRRDELLLEAAQKAEQASRAKSEFLANMSHEIRTPMSAVIGLSYLLSQTQLDRHQRAFLSKIQASSKALLAVITDILDLSKIEAGELMVDHTPFSVHGLLEGLVEVMDVEAHAKGITLEIDFARNLPVTLQGDATRLTQILTNLLSNAIKFTERGGVTLSVTRLDDNPATATICFIVKDTGIGISAEAQARLFSPFVQADTSITRRYGGTGLGLSIVKSLANLLGGDVHLKSELGVGSEFWVVLEFAAVAREGASTPQAAEMTPAQSVLGKVRVLLVDDSDINLDVTKCILELNGARVTLANNGQKAIDYLRESPHECDIVLMDVQMPFLNGHDATRRIRDELGLVNLPVIGLTAGALQSERQLGMSAGMDDFIVKPFDAPTLVRSILKHVESASRRPGTPLPIVLRDATAGTLWPAIDGINAADARARTCNDVALFSLNLKRLLDEFVGIADAGVGDGAGALDAHAVGMHKLIGSAGMLGANAIQQLAADTRSACVAGDLQRAKDLTALLALQLHSLRRSAAPVFAAATRVEEAHAQCDFELGSAQLMDFIHMLRKQRLSALYRFGSISPQLQGLLGKDSLEVVRDHMENLRFTEAANVLEECRH